MDAHQIAQNRRRAQALAERASEMRSNLEKMRSRMSESGLEYVACSPEEALAMVRDDASSSSSTSSRVSDPSNAPELPTIRASAAHVAYAIDMGGCMEVMMGKTSVPQVFVKGQFIGGCNDGGLGGTVPLLKSGKLQEMLQ